MEALGFFGFVLVVVGLTWALLLFCIPFMIWSILGKMDKLIKLQEEANRVSGVISTNVYAYLTGGGHE